MDRKEQELTRKIRAAKHQLKLLEEDNTKPLATKERLRLLWEGELTNAEERLYHHRLSKE